MPHINRACKQNGCPALVRSPARYCAKHVDNNTIERQRREYDAQRYDAEHRIYNDARWKHLRKMFLCENPFCQIAALCVQRLGHIAPATDVHHKQSVRERPDLTYEWSNLESACHECHSQHTAREQGWAKQRDEEPIT
jgi:5-methylcytosine-specific restriction protein A